MGSLVGLIPSLLKGAERPNVIVIISDDQGWADIGYNNPKVYTPHLDKLAQTGATFVNHYVMPQCTPTRVAVMTPLYSRGTTGITNLFPIASALS